MKYDNCGYFGGILGDFRVKYLPREYIVSPPVFKFNKLFSDTNEQIQTKLALFLYHAMDRRINYRLSKR